jgi:acyl-CoA reductase-like NAD-dependent aldehyde dehydrogenase
MKVRNKLFIDGKWTDSSSGKTLPVVDPSDNSEMARVAAGTAEDVHRAAAAAKRCFDSGAWSRLPILERSRILNRIGDLIRERVKGLAELESRDTGKPFLETVNFDVPGSALTFNYYASLSADTVPRKAPSVSSPVIREADWFEYCIQVADPKGFTLGCGIAISNSKSGSSLHRHQRAGERAVSRPDAIR